MPKPDHDPACGVEYQCHCGQATNTDCKLVPGFSCLVSRCPCPPVLSSFPAPAIPCPRCGSFLDRWYGQVSGDPDDSEPHAECSNPDCDYWY